MTKRKLPTDPLIQILIDAKQIVSDRILENEQYVVFNSPHDTRLKAIMNFINEAQEMTYVDLKELRVEKIEINRMIRENSRNMLNQIMEEG